MGFRLRRSLRLLPGVRVNLSRGGVSLSVGGKGLTANFSRRGTRATVGLPGTGLSYSLSSPREADGPAAPGGRAVRRWMVVGVLAALAVGALLLFGR